MDWSKLCLLDYLNLFFPQGSIGGEFLTIVAIYNFGFLTRLSIRNHPVVNSSISCHLWWKSDMEWITRSDFWSEFAILGHFMFPKIIHSSLTSAWVAEPRSGYVDSMRLFAPRVFFCLADMATPTARTNSYKGIIRGFRWTSIGSPRSYIISISRFLWFNSLLHSSW